jgi:aminoglycoside phosphotransferase family enzyme/predicted kinase
MHEPSFYPHPVRSITVRETHISWIFLTGPFAYKAKKPVNLGFLDFSSREKRKHYCRRELELNRRLTTGVYLDVLPVTGDGNGFRLGGPGPPIDYLVKMKQLSPQDSMERLLADNNIGTSALEFLARRLSRFYRDAVTGPQIDEFGSWDIVAQNCEENFNQITEVCQGEVDDRRLKIIAAVTRGFLEDHKDLFRQRVENGRIREGHGDLRPEHVYITAEGLQIIDCIEFNDRYRCGDVVGDLAFLAMALDDQGFPQSAGALMSEFSRQSGDQRLFALLDFYKCYRAMVRLKVAGLRFSQEGIGNSERAEVLDRIRRYTDLAFRYAAQFSRPTVYLVCGIVATGKTSLSRALAESLCLRRLSSDVIRKRIFSTSDGSQLAFGEGIYSAAATSLTYGQLFLMAQVEIESGRSVVLDATFSRKDQRHEAVRLAADAGAAIVFVECTCSAATIRKRLAKRTEANSVSDARLHHLDDLTAAFESLDEIPSDCRVRIDTENPLDENLQNIFYHTATLKNMSSQGSIQ